MGRKSIAVEGKQFGSLPLEAFTLEPGDNEALSRILKKVENQVRRNAKHDHKAMRRVDALRLLAALRVVGIVAIKQIITRILEGDNAMTKFAFEYVYKNNDEQMKELLDLVYGSLGKSEKPEDVVDPHAKRFSEKMGSIKKKVGDESPE